MLRHPWGRLQSCYYYLIAHPNSNLLSPDINTTALLSTAPTIQEFIAYPGISNCMTKMLNGIRCGADKEVTAVHLDVAQKVLTAMTGFGITEYFNTSVCLFYWMYGGDVHDRYFQRWRVGGYQSMTAEQSMSHEAYQLFLHRERFDLALYSFAEDLFLSRLQATGCPVVDGLS